MTAVVVDASVAAKWFFPEEGSGAAVRLIRRDRTLLAPDLISPELSNVVWKRCRRREITAEEAAGIVRDFLRVPIDVRPSRPLVAPALELAVHVDRTVYDCLYLALAIERRCPFVTGDRRFARSIADGPFARHVRPL